MSHSTPANSTLAAKLLMPLKWLDENLEKVIILISYSGMAGIIFVEVIRRFFFGLQAPWSTSIPVLLFLWLTWFGASLNVKKRTHLSLNEIRMRLPYKGQFLCQILDAILWIVFGIIVIYFTTAQVKIAHFNFATVAGTDNIMQWWFYLATPLAWTLLIFRVLQNLVEDCLRFKRNESFNLSPAIMD
ncbi:TRAP transporter small permease [Billgrantia aerodenitrificans]|uniref:TRAP transporter small permease protein n=1 Tax=Billgrantia aerodenitrificans TaxID=2733483 RepID=A0ABS9ANH6_9GAMM|nr:TRAP transporter small permease [Halomonas aerodenitrificans]MCE8023396.1 TRAP transporter small permease [Halomonas aerodenitrificans]